MDDKPFSVTFVRRIKSGRSANHMFKENLVVTGWREKVSPVLLALVGTAAGYASTLCAISLGALLLM